MNIVKFVYRPYVQKKAVEFHRDDIVCVYSGKPNCCMCGCSGKYYYSSKNREYGSKERGYKVGDNEVSDKMITKVISLFRDYIGEIEGIDNYIFTIYMKDLDKEPYRQYTIYLKNKKL